MDLVASAELSTMSLLVGDVAGSMTALSRSEPALAAAPLPPLTLPGASLGRQKARGGEPAPLAAAEERSSRLSTSCTPAAPDAGCTEAADMVIECLARTAASWYMPDAGRRDAERALAGRGTGAFILRSTAGGSYCLSFVEPVPGYRRRRSFRSEARGAPAAATKVSHQLVVQSPADGKYRLQGSSVPFESVTRLVAFYCHQRDVLPSLLQLPPAAHDLVDGCHTKFGTNAAGGSCLPHWCCAEGRLGWPDSEEVPPGDWLSSPAHHHCSGSTAAGQFCSRQSHEAAATSTTYHEPEVTLPVPSQHSGTRPSTLHTSLTPASLGSGCPVQQQQQQQLPPPTPPPRRRRFLPLPTAFAGQSSPSCCSGSTISGCQPGALASFPAAASMATVYTTTATLQKPMRLAYDATSDMVCMSSAEDGVFSDGSVATSTKAVICLGTSETVPASGLGADLGDTGLPSCCEQLRGTAVDSLPVFTGRVNRVVPATTDTAPVYYASALDDRLSDYEDIWPPSPIPEPAGCRHRTRASEPRHRAATAAGGSAAPHGALHSRQLTNGSAAAHPAISCSSAAAPSCVGEQLLPSGLVAVVRSELLVENDDDDPLGGSGPSFLLSDSFPLVGGTQRRSAAPAASASGSGTALALQLSSGSSVVAAAAAATAVAARRLATPGSHRRGSQQPAVSGTASGASNVGSSLKVSPVRCDIIRAGSTVASVERTAGTVAAGAVSSAAAHERPPCTRLAQEATSLATARSSAADLAGIRSLRAQLQQVLAHSGTDVSNRDSGTIDNDCEDDIEHRALEFMCSMNGGGKSGASVVRTTSLKEKVITAAPVLPQKPQTLPVHLLRKPDLEEPSQSADRQAVPAPLRGGADHAAAAAGSGRTPSEIADELTAACSPANGRADSATPLPPRCPKFPLSLRLSSGSGSCCEEAGAAIGGRGSESCGVGDGSFALPRRHREQASTLRQLIESSLPECVLPAICPLTSSNLQRLSTYDNVTLLPQRPNNRLSSGSSSTVFSKPWDASRIEEIFQNARVRSRINTSALSETTEEEDGGGAGGRCRGAVVPHLQPGSPAGVEEDGRELAVDDDDITSAALSPPLQQQPLTPLQQQLLTSSPADPGAPVVASAAAADHGRTVVLRQRPGRAAAATAATTVQPAILEPARASKYRRSVDFNREAISARSHCGDSPKDVDAQDGDSGTELEGAAHDEAAGAQKQEPGIAEPKTCCDQASRDLVMVYNDSQASLQTFSEQVKLMRAPSLNACGERGGVVGSRPPAPGAAIQEHVCQLARNRGTTFGSAVDHFIRCTRESSEPNPHVMLRNVRQFMSGIKNYLTQQGEGSFTELLHSVQQRLAPNEFLNIDMVLEAALLKCVAYPLKPTIDKVFVAYCTSNGSLKELAEGIKVARSRSAVELGMKASLVPPQGQSMETIQSWFDKMQKASSPVRKLESLLSACSAIFSGMRLAGESVAVSSLAAEDFLVVMTYVVAQCGLVTAEIEADYMRGLLQSSLSSGEGGYYLNALSSSVAIIRSLARSYPSSSLQLQPTQPASGYSGLTCAGGSVRVHVPNETTGSIMARTIPVRPCMTAKEIRSMVAHKLFITNPQDYALYVVAGGVEHRLSDSDTVDGFVVGTTVATAATAAAATPSAAVVFKRISAHIVWPSVMMY